MTKFFKYAISFICKKGKHTSTNLVKFKYTEIKCHSIVLWLFVHINLNKYELLKKQYSKTKKSLIGNIVKCLQRLFLFLITVVYYKLVEFINHCFTIIRAGNFPLAISNYVPLSLLAMPHHVAMGDNVLKIGCVANPLLNRHIHNYI